ILFGSDWPVCLLAASYESVLAIVEGHTKHFSTLQKEKLFGKNAARIYKIKE
ncbi:MAG TPA: amidohydrolase, partial [Flavobacteriaceae bacterium]|nr:amidohydrolase [Flavobacteriaceae bacterium]